MFFATTKDIKGLQDQLSLISQLLHAQIAKQTGPTLELVQAIKMEVKTMSETIDNLTLRVTEAEQNMKDAAAAMDAAAQTITKEVAAIADLTKQLADQAAAQNDPALQALADGLAASTANLGQSTATLRAAIPAPPAEQPAPQQQG